MASTSKDNDFQMGEHTLPIPMSLHSLNRRRMVKNLVVDKETCNSVVLLQGGEASGRFCSDVDVMAFRQESYFHWAFGVLEVGFYGAVDVTSGESTLYIPRFPDEYTVWMGPIKTTDHFKNKYGVDRVMYIDEMSVDLRRDGSGLLLTLHGLNTDSRNYSKEATFDGISEFIVNNSILHPIMRELRVIKTDMELDVMRYANKISSEAHIQIMRRMKVGAFEYQYESLFLDYCYRVGGMRHMGYTCICASGENNGVLHYGHAGAPNDKKITGRDLCLFDMGGEYYCYTSDITCSFPANGQFTADQKLIYEAVLASNRAVLAACRPGVAWADMHRLSERVLLEGLRNGGLVTGDIDEMHAARVSAVFMPHGLGHLMGLDVHDVGGFPEGHNRLEGNSLRSLRMNRDLEAGMVVTIEPGCYFINPVLDAALSNPEISPFLVPEVIERFRNTGGARIEDDVIITSDGAELMTQVPRSVEEIEAVMADPIVEPMIPAANQPTVSQ